MARDVANVQTAIWGSPDWKSLTALEQWLYLHLLSHPTLSYAGVADWFPKRIAAGSRDITADQVEALAQGLQAARFVFISDDTDEILIRSFLRHDGLLKQPKLSVSMANAFAAVASIDIQRVIVKELQKLSSEHPEWKAFESEKVQAILKHEGADMDELRVEPGDDLPKGLPIGLPLDLPKDLPQTAGSGLPLPTATATTTSPNGEGDGASRKRRATQLPPDWEPKQQHFDKAKHLGVNLNHEAEQFATHHQARGNTFKNWDMAFSNWLGKAKQFQPAENQNDGGWGRSEPY